VIILTTSGAKTGNIRKTRIKDGDTYVAVASNGRVRQSVVIPLPHCTPRSLAAGRRDGLPAASP
jgi:hypothetical protein